MWHVFIFLPNIVCGVSVSDRDCVWMSREGGMEKSDPCCTTSATVEVGFLSMFIIMCPIGEAEIRWAHHSRNDNSKIPQANSNSTGEKLTSKWINRLGIHRCYYLGTWCNSYGKSYAITLRFPIQFLPVKLLSSGLRDLPWGGSSYI